MANSIRKVEERSGGGAAVTQIRLLFQNSTFKQKVIVLIEGPDDRLCYENIFSPMETVLLPENIRFHKTIVESLELVYPGKLISIRDADFSNADGTVSGNPNMFFTDAHDMETMFLQGGNLKEMAGEYSELVTGIDVNSLCQVLSDYSYLKWYNFNRHTNLAFDELNTVQLYECGELGDKITLFRKVCSKSPMHSAKIDEMESFCMAHPLVELMLITNGHDLMDCIYSEMHKKKCGNLSKKKVLKSLISHCSLRMFQRTQLYSKLVAWGMNNTRTLFAA